MNTFHFPQFEHEPFYIYFDRLREHVAQCCYSYQTSELCQVIYNGVNNESRGFIDSLSEGNLNEMTDENIFELFKYLAYDTWQWDLQNNHCETLSTQERSSMSTEDMVRSLAISIGGLATNLNNLTTTISQQQLSITNIETQIGQMKNTIMRLEAQDEFDFYVDKSQYECAIEYENPSPPKLNVNHSCDFYDEDDEDMFDSEEDGRDLSCSLSSQFVCSHIDHPPCANIDMSHIHDNFLKDSGLSGDLTLKVLFNVMVEEKQERVTFEKEEVVLKKVKQIDEFSSKDTPFIVPLRDLQVSVPNALHDFFLSYPISTKPHPSYKEPYRDIEFIFEHSGPKNCLLYVCAFIVHVWFCLIIIYYYHFSSLFASIFDRLLRALSCSDLDLSCC